MLNNLKALIFTSAFLMMALVMLPIQVIAADELLAFDNHDILYAMECTYEVFFEAPEPEPEGLYLSEEDIRLIALITMAEAEDEPELGKRLVIDVVLNRYDHPKFPNDIYGVIYAKNQFEPTSNGRLNRCYVRDDIVELVREELKSRTNSEALYFRMNHYFKWGTPLFNVGNHYFSC